MSPAADAKAKDKLRIKAKDKLTSFLWPVRRTLLPSVLFAPAAASFCITPTSNTFQALRMVRTHRLRQSLDIGHTYWMKEDGPPSTSGKGPAAP